MTSPMGATVAQQAPARSRTQMSRWWPISFFIAALVFIIIGGGLIGAWTSSVNNFYDDDSFDTVGNNGEFYGGVACLVIAGICKLVGWILLIVRCMQRQRSPPTVIAYPYQPPNQYAMPATRGGYVTIPGQASTPAPSYTNYQTAPNESGMAMRYCGNCGAAVTTPFCAQCGTKG